MNIHQHDIYVVLWCVNYFNVYAHHCILANEQLTFVEIIQ